MEFCMAARALKSSLRRELSFIKSTEKQVFLDDIWCGTAISAVSTEDFSVDDLLDFSNGEFEVESVEEEDEKDSVSVSSSRDRVDDDNNSNSGSFSSDQSLLTNEFLETVDDYAELEWVSQFVDDSSCSEFSLLYPNYAKPLSEPAEKLVLNETPCFPLPVPSRARTKRTRRTSGVWSLGSPLSTESTTSSPSSSSSGLSSTSCLIFTNTAANIEWLDSFSEPALKKSKKKAAVQSGGLFQRRCSHCQTPKTPQWRTGPLGPKTLCNACGVRYKSGRLFPEYRPACSPTFSVEMHSNSHRKVLEMRRKKEMTGPKLGMTPMVQSF